MINRLTALINIEQYYNFYCIFMVTIRNFFQKQTNKKILPQIFEQ